MKNIFRNLVGLSLVSLFCLTGCASSPKTVHLDPIAYSQLEAESRGEFVGIGIIFEETRSFPKIIHVVPGSPAERSGIETGDEILEAGGVNLKGTKFEQAVSLLRGEPNSLCRLTVKSHATGSIRKFEIPRRLVPEPSLGRVEKTPDGIVSIQILAFTDRTTQELIEKLERERPFEAVVLDLRGNEGGVLDSGVKTAELFLARDRIIVATRGSRVEDNALFKAVSNGPYCEVPLFILIDSKTASAAEVLTAALSYRHRAVTIGERTYGKASIQSVLPERDGSAVYRTTAHYYTPEGQMIEKRGIRPEVRALHLSEDDVLQIVRERLNYTHGQKTTR